MTTLLHIDASPRQARSLSRQLSGLFIREWFGRRPEDELIYRDIGLNPPPAMTEAWIAAAFTPPGQRTTGQQEALRCSDQLIDELERSDLIVMGTPMHNYGMPSALKAWFDQVIRINRTFSFDPAEREWPLSPNLTGKTLVILSSRGEFGFEPGGIREHMNHLETHIRTCAHYLGVVKHHAIVIDYQEFDDDRHARSVQQAHQSVPELITRISRDMGRAGYETFKASRRTCRR